MSQQQAVQPIVLKQENGEVVLKLVLENPKQETQTLILQQPDDKEFKMSTDTTAIWSFVGAMLVATIATIFFGVKSFKLTKMSFDIVKDQIKSSEEQIIKTNNELLNTQKILKDKEIYAQYKQKWIDDLRNVIANYITGAIEFQNGVNRIYHCFEEADFVAMVYDENSRQSREYNELAALYLRIYSESIKIRTYLDPRINECKKLLEEEQLFLAKVPDLMAFIAKGDKKEIKEKLDIFAESLHKIRDILIVHILEKDLGGK